MENRTSLFKGVVWMAAALTLGLPKVSGQPSQVRSFAVKKGSALEVYVIGGPVRIRAWDKDEIAVSAKVPDEAGLSMVQTEGKVKVEYRTDKTTKAGQVIVEIDIPKDFDVNVSTLGGDIVLQQVSDGRIKASTTGGNVTLSDFAGRLEVLTTGGNIAAGRILGTASLDAQGGNIVVGRTGQGTQVDNGASELSSTIDATSTGGDVSVYANPRGNSHKIFSSGGRAFLFLPEDVRATVNARIMVKGDWNSHSKKLDIRSEFEAKNYLRDEQRKEIHGTYILNGGGDTIAVETLTGNIEIRKIKPSR